MKIKTIDHLIKELKSDIKDQEKCRKESVKNGDYEEALRSVQSQATLEYVVDLINGKIV